MPSTYKKDCGLSLGRITILTGKVNVDTEILNVGVKNMLKTRGNKCDIEKYT